MLSIIILGGSGDLAKKKTFPSLFRLFCHNLIPETTQLIGYARSEIELESFRSRATQYIKETEQNKLQLENFKQKIFYVQGQYNSPADFSKLHNFIKLNEQSDTCDRLFYLALPSSSFVDAASSARESCISQNGWNRLIVEKPFGTDLESARELSFGLGEVWPEEDIYRIDHYLGKELVQNLMILRFANSIWEPLWNRSHIKCVKITFKEDFGTEGRGGYFDKYGIIRDIMQNHLMQVLSLVAMEPPATLNPEDIRDEKVKVLKGIKPLRIRDVVLGQYTRNDKGNEGYLDDSTVPPNSNCATYAQATLYINNSRWKGVPFIIKSAKAVEERKAEVRIQFQDNPSDLYKGIRSELVIRIQPDPAVYILQTSKLPGLTSELAPVSLSMIYSDSFPDSYHPDAYERLILESINGNSNLFVRVDELDESWKIFSPLLRDIEEKDIKPILYPYGSRGPVEADIRSLNFGFVIPKPSL